MKSSIRSQPLVRTRVLERSGEYHMCERGVDDQSCRRFIAGRWLNESSHRLDWTQGSTGNSDRADSGSMVLAGFDGGQPNPEHAWGRLVIARRPEVGSGTYGSSLGRRQMRKPTSTSPFSSGTIHDSSL